MLCGRYCFAGGETEAEEVVVVFFFFFKSLVQSHTAGPSNADGSVLEHPVLTAVLFCLLLS